MNRCDGTEKRRPEWGGSHGRSPVLDAGSEAKDFKYTDANGNTYTGTTAIDRMAKDFPEILDFMWVLPPSLRLKGLKTVYKASGVARRTIAKVTKRPCNCGR